MPTDTKLNQLIINQLTQEQYDEAKAAGTLSDTELYITDSDDDPQVKSNLSQTIDDSTTKYPSNKAVKDESSRIVSIMDNVQTVLSSSISDETTNRTNADANLQNQINSKVSLWASGNCVRFGNFQICWGFTGGNEQLITFSQPFKDTSYTITVTGRNTKNEAYATVIRDETKTSTSVRIYCKYLDKTYIAVGYWN